MLYIYITQNFTDRATGEDISHLNIKLSEVKKDTERIGSAAISAMTKKLYSIADVNQLSSHCKKQGKKSCKPYLTRRTFKLIGNGFILG